MAFCLRGIFKKRDEKDQEMDLETESKVRLWANER